MKPTHLFLEWSKLSFVSNHFTGYDTGKHNRTIYENIFISVMYNFSSKGNAVFTIFEMQWKTFPYKMILI